MKNKKLNLGELKVNSFIINLDATEKLTLRGGETLTCTFGYSECNPCIPRSENCIRSVNINDCIAVESITC